MKKVKMFQPEPLRMVQSNGPEVTPEEKPLPPPPPQMDRPVVKPPETYEEFMAIAVKARSGRLEMAVLWATLAQAAATQRVAEQLQRLNVFLGVDDLDPDRNVDGSGEDEPRLEGVLANAMVGAMLGAKDELLGELPDAVRKKAENGLVEQVFGVKVGKG